MLKIKNTLTGQKQEFIALKSVKMYTCGVTVYDDCHIGHGRSLYIFEVIRRYLKHIGFKVNLVRNITDIDDKIINKARVWAKDKNISLKDAFDKVRTTYIKSYKNDLKLLNIPEADYEPKATENIKEMIKYISKLIEKGFAYSSGGSVYFSVRKFKGYGKLSGKKIDDLLESVRINSDEHKKDPLDFALWKKAKDDEPFWDSPWGKGRPGWHIECSVMSQKYLKTDTLDIHGGGRDLVFPHHENERAQSEALTGKTFARFWIHHGLLTINRQKMAKSLGNFITIKDFILKHKDDDFLKLFFLSAHYSSSIDFSEEKLEEVKKQKKSFYSFFDKVDSRIKGKENFKPLAMSDKDKAKIDGICKKFKEAMDNDFNMPQALACMFELIDLGAKFDSCNNEEALNYIDSKLRVFFNIFGLKRKEKKPIPDEIKQKVVERAQARENKDFKKADEIRNQIEKKFKVIIADSGPTSSIIQVDLPDESSS